MYKVCIKQNKYGFIKLKNHDNNYLNKNLNVKLTSNY